MLYPQIQIAVLSAYDDYNYVRCTLKEGILDYLLKSELELKDIDALLELAEKHAFQKQKEEQGRAENAVYDSYLLAEKFARFLKAPDQGDESFLPQISGSLDLERLHSVIFLVRHVEDKKLAPFEILEAMKKICAEKSINSVIIPYQNDSFISLCELPPEDAEASSAKLMAYGSEFLLQHMGCEITYFVCARIPDMSRLTSVIIEEEGVLIRKKYYQNNRVPFLAASEPFQAKEQSFVNGCKDKISALLKEKKLDGAIQALEEFLAQSVINIIDPQRYINTCVSICYLFSNHIQAAAGGRNVPAVEDTVFQALRTQTAEELSGLMHLFVDKILEDLIRNRRYSATIEKSLSFIEENCFDKLSLEQVSNHVFLNKSYFSELFKKETGVNFNDYINQLRIRKACDLLLQNEYSLSEVAQMVGFSDQNYFSKIFKKIVGKSPKSYKNSIYKREPNKLPFNAVDSTRF